MDNLITNAFRYNEKGTTLTVTVGANGDNWYISVADNGACLLDSSIIRCIMYGSIAVGVLVELAFGCVLAIELRQDRIINDYYTKNRSSDKTPQQILDDEKGICK